MLLLLLLPLLQRVGADALGNAYYRKFERQPDGGMREVRFAAFKDSEYDPQAVPPEWMQWLHRTRKAPPTDDDLAAGLAQREQFKRLVAAADSAEEARRRQEQSGGGVPRQPPVRQLDGT